MDITYPNIVSIDSICRLNKLSYQQMMNIRRSKPEHVCAHEELVAVEEDSRDVAQDEDEDDAD